MHENKATIEGREPNDLNSCSTNESDQLNNSGHGMCEYMGATHSSHHTTPDAKHSSTCCFPTHEMWELPTPLIVANRSQQEDEGYGNYPLVLYTGILTSSHPYLKSFELQLPQRTPEQHRFKNLLSHNAQNLRDSSTETTIGSYELNQRYPTLLTQQKALIEAQDRILTLTQRAT
ncbi:hypothetical protein F511_27638 [Dorcoceras hygrometricum]|uniref:Uncharacterized protein n=1 Tax=Dorcoceras hygrometricum TaxID=472368 RepID=A0A2Z7BC58_9LAMI|nr:hypothetical protein F511_27638 [Dorcoceras hygrometricum]